MNVKDAISRGRELAQMDKERNAEEAAMRKEKEKKQFDKDKRKGRKRFLKNDYIFNLIKEEVRHGQRSIILDGTKGEAAALNEIEGIEAKYIIERRTLLGDYRPVCYHTIKITWWDWDRDRGRGSIAI